MGGEDVEAEHTTLLSLLKGREEKRKKGKGRLREGLVCVCVCVCGSRRPEPI